MQQRNIELSDLSMHRQIYYQIWWGTFLLVTWENCRKKKKEVFKGKKNEKISGEIVFYMYTNICMYVYEKNEYKLPK